MSTKIPLEFFDSLDLRLIAQGVKAPVTRLMVRTSFVTPQGTATEEQRAILDTGAPLSLLPHKIWSQCEVIVQGDFPLQGIVDEDCKMPVKIGRLTCLLPTENGSVIPVPLTAFLAPDDSVPLLLGMEGLLHRFELVMNYPAKAAYLQEVEV